jgi:CheY-like chemotaxis protein/HPt (histidine-containing phosphotransfer) domain-containing protein
MMPGMTGFELARAVKADRQLSNVRLVLMPSFGKRGHASDARDAGIAAYLVKPVRQAELEECLLAVARDQQPAGAEPRLVTRHSLAEASGRLPQRILIAEDNAVNQKVLIAQVSRLGYRADIVSDGEKALAALARTPYALVLMDLHMPVLDGYAATATIREREGLRLHTPVIAVTASVIEGEREKCLAAGIDDYLPKPVRSEDLSAMLTKWMPRAFPRGPVGGEQVVGRGHLDVGAALRAAGEPEPNLATARAADPIALGAITEGTVSERLDDLLRECGPDLVASFIDAFMSDTDERMVRLRSAVLSRDAVVLEHEAHSLKGSALNLGGTRFAFACRSLEKAGEAHDFGSIAAALDLAEAELETLRRCLYGERNVLMSGAAAHDGSPAPWSEWTVGPPT